MFDLSLVTCAYTNLRKSRPKDYYLRPLRDLIDELRNSQIGLFVFTNEPPEMFGKPSDNIFINHIPIDDFAAEMWGLPNWRADYMENLKDRPVDRFEEAVVPELIGIWLGKFPMLQYAAEHSKNVLWVDSGLKVGPICQKQIANYYKSPIDSNFQNRILTKFKNHSFGFMNMRHRDWFHKISMSKYEEIFREQFCFKPEIIQAGCIFSRQALVSDLKEGVRKQWLYLLSNGDYGTEENPLTLYRWTRSDALAFSYWEWISLLGYDKKVTRKIKMV